MSRYKILLFIVIIYVMSSFPIFSSDLYHQQIKLNHSYQIDISEIDAGVIEVKLSKNNKLINKITLDNAGIKKELVENINIDNYGECDYFITVYNLGSTYGAQTNIIVWDNGMQWNMICLPFERGFAEDRNEDNIYEIVNYYPEETVYSFNNGLLIIW